MDTIALAQEGPDRVRATGIRGEPAPETAKVCINTLGGHKNSMSIVLTGLDIEEKAKIVEETLFKSLGGKERFQLADVQLIRSDKADPPSNDQAFALLRITVMDPDAKKVAQFSAKLVELALASIPGFTATAPPGKGSPAVVHWPALVAMKHLDPKLTLDGQDIPLPPPSDARPEEAISPIVPELPPMPAGPTVQAPLGRAFATRAGDKGGNANLGIWAKTPEAYVFLREFLTVEKLKALLPDCAPFAMDRYELPNLLAVNFYIRGLLGEGVAASLRSDPQAKTLGEYLRAKVWKCPNRSW